jgi:hypothetical protein
MVPERKITSEARLIAQYFRKETELVAVPPLPVLAASIGLRERVLAGLRTVAMAGAIAGAVFLLATTAGKETHLSSAIDSVSKRYGVSEEITGFLMEAAEKYRDSMNGGID